MTLDPATGKQVGQTEPTGGTGAKQPLLTVEGWDVHWDGRQLTGEKA